MFYSKTYRLVVLCIIYLLAILLPLSIESPEKLFGKEDLYSSTVEEFQSYSPEYVFIGNSMLGSRVDEKAISRLIPQKKIKFFQYDGSGSSSWYLFTKNVLPKTDAKRAYITTIGSHLTCSHYSLRSKNNVIAMLSASPDLREEDDFNSIASSNSSTPIQDVREWESAQEYNQLKVHIDELFKELSRETFNLDSGAIDEANKLMRLDADNALKSLSDDSLGENDSCGFDFDSQIKSSFLPDMVNELNSAGVKGYFIRVKPRPAEDGSVRESEEEAEYYRKLANFIDDSGHIFIDTYEIDPATPDMFRGKAHIDDPVEFTPIFYNFMKEYLE